MQKNQVTRIYNVGKKIEQVLTAVLAESNLTIRLWTLLSLLQDGHTTNQALQIQLQTNKSTLSRQLNQLVQQDLIRLNEISSDRHQKHYQLTPHGLQVLNQATQQISQLDDAVFKYWSKDEKQFLTVLLNRFESDLIKRKV
ncbi:MarR family winged helix-turn-helix transcriptional regulator [Agrilactobacillus yilanensis]|uniref:MarR family winged helix-turn-helix transcriptional regulator n=1 Tax=Agrilactobacillus yilanensis TaxID=2485997 RepID=A0ABW4J9J8_9LACO|nr:winged helix-turn-helix transcriptional regulator [Agrilactobacillus yilanensis]